MSTLVPRIHECCVLTALVLLLWMEHVPYIVGTELFEDLLGSNLTNECIPLLASLSIA